MPNRLTVFLIFFSIQKDRSKNGKLTKQQMVAIYKDMSDLDPKRISEVVNSLEKALDEDHSGYVGEKEKIFKFSYELI